ncbi:MAG: c-type cytochrome, partial [Thermoanaerobaculia bacterium]
MVKLAKIVGSVVLVVVLIVAAGVAFIALRFPKMRPPSDEKVAATPARLERGEYLVHHVSDCLGCHSEHFTTFAMPVKPGTEGEGGYPFDEKLGVPGVVCAQNITADPEHGLGRWTDGEILRAFREGVDRNGKELFPMMPYRSFAEMSDEDARSVVVYLRTLPAVAHTVPKRHLNFPVNLMIKLVPRPVTAPVATPDDRVDHLAYGKYIVTIAGCKTCHTAREHGQEVKGRDFAGGWEMKGPWGRVVTANITPEEHTFVGQATKAEFISRFKAFASFTPETMPAADPGKNTVMPWLALSGMTEQ